MATASFELLPGMAILPASNPAVFKIMPGTNYPVAGLYYDPSTSESAYWDLKAADYASAPTCEIEWYADTASSGAVVWQVALAAITPNTDSQDIETKAFATAQQATDTHLGATGQRLHSDTITISNVDSLAAGDRLRIRITRLPADAGDTMTGDAVLVGATFAYTTT